MDVDEVADVDEELQVEDSSNDHVFQPFPDPDDPDFELLFSRAVFHIVRVRQIHSRKHTPTCFKYRSKKCRFRFPRNIVLTTTFDPTTGVIYLKRNHPYLNNYNKWFTIMTRGNHDVQFLFTKNHALAIMHYIMKYISKPEAALHSKLTVAAAVRKAMAMSPQPDSDAFIAKRMLLKTYNKLDSLREVGVPEAISHLLKFPDHYTDATFVNIHTTHLLRHMRDLTTNSHKTRPMTTSTPKSLSLIADSPPSPYLMITPIVGRPLGRIVCTIIALNFIRQRNSTAFSSMPLILSTAITLNFFETKPVQYPHSLASCCS
jgi:hypothetical protein